MHQFCTICNGPYSIPKLTSVVNGCGKTGIGSEGICGKDGKLGIEGIGTARLGIGKLGSPGTAGSPGTLGSVTVGKLGRLGNEGSEGIDGMGIAKLGIGKLGRFGTGKLTPGMFGKDTVGKEGKLGIDGRLGKLGIGIDRVGMGTTYFWLNNTCPPMLAVNSTNAFAMFKNLQNIDTFFIYVDAIIITLGPVAKPRAQAEHQALSQRSAHLLPG